MRTLRALLEQAPGRIRHKDVPQLMAILQALPDRPPPPVHDRQGHSKRGKLKRIDLTKEMRQALNKEFERTQLKASDLKVLMQNEDYGADAYRDVGRWRLGNVKSVQENKWRLVMHYLAKIPDAIIHAPSSRKDAKTPAIGKPVRKPRAQAFTSVDDSVPRPDLKPEAIQPPKDRPKIKGYRVSGMHQRLGYVVIDDEIYDRLHALRRQTLVSPRRLILSAHDAPADLEISQVRNWFLGVTLSAEKEHLNWVLNTYESWPVVNDG